jgi:HK97 family phage major capsid protein
MASPFLDTLRSRREAMQADIDAITRAAAEANPARDLTEAETKNVQGLIGELGPLDERIRQMHEIEERRLSFTNDARRVDGLAHGLLPAVTGPAPAERNRSWGEQFTESGAPAEYLRGGAKGQGRAVEVAGSPLRERVITTADIAGLVQPMVLPSIPEPDDPPRVLSLVRRGGTSAAVIQYMQEGTFTSRAAKVVEGNPKPESTLALTPKTAVVSTYAHWVAITRQTLEDAPMMRAYIDGRLREGLLDVIEDLVLNGDGPSMPGIITGATAVTGADLFEVVLAGVAAVQEAGWRATAAVCNGSDFYSLVASIRNMGGSDSSLITDSFPYRIFGLPLVVTPEVASGTVLVGDFARGAQLWDRHATQVLVADQHADFFIRNQLVILAEWRGCVTVYAPDAFAKGTIVAVTPPDGEAAAAAKSTRSR